MDIIEEIKALDNALKNERSPEEVTIWWDWCMKIEASMEADMHATDHEKATIDRLKQAVSRAIASVRKNHEPDTFSIGVSLTALQHSIERRTTGADGYPVR